MNTVIIYHGNCPDGFGAAYAAWLKYKDAAEYHACLHGVAQEPPDCTEKDVYILDYCFNAEQLKAIGDCASSVTVLDHHETWIEALHGFSHPKISLQFDQFKSGTTLAWDFFHPESPVPLLLQHIETRDLRKPLSDEASHALASLDFLGFDFKLWDIAVSLPENSIEFDNFLKAGALLESRHNLYCMELAKNPTKITLRGIPGLVKNMAGKSFGSAVGSMLANQCGSFAVLWHIDEKNRVRCSIHSVAGLSIRHIAESFGGGGHENAAGFNLSLAQLPDLLAGNL